MVYEDSMYGKSIWLFRMAVPYLVLLVLFAFDFIYLPFPYVYAVEPAFFLMGLYYWAVYRPSLLPPTIVFAVGMLIDLLMMSPLGLNAFVYLLAYFFVRQQRRFLTGQSFFTFWIGFMLVCFGTAMLEWGAGGLAAFEWGPLEPICFNVVISFFLFPFVVLLLILVHKVLPGAR